MSLIGLLVLIALVGLIVWAIRELIPMPEQFQKIILVVAIVVVVLFVLSAFGLMPDIGSVRVGK